MKILDCTVRDGGYVNNWNFNDEDITTLYESLNESGVDYMEVGFRTEKRDEFKQFGKYFFCDEELINKVIHKKQCKIAVMCQIGNVKVENFVPKSQSKIDTIRVLMAYHSVKNTSDTNFDYETFKEGINLINSLCDLGYEVSFNIGRIDKISNEQMYIICKELSKTNISYFYMADTYGATNLLDVKKLIKLTKFLFQDMFNSKIKIGFHAHNNLKNATSKAIFALDCGAEITDGCVHGFGRGSGNAETEMILLELAKKSIIDNINFVNLFQLGQEILIKYNKYLHLKKDEMVYALSALYGMHVNYAVNILDKDFDVIKINDIFSSIVKKNKHMYFNKCDLEESIKLFS